MDTQCPDLRAELERHHAACVGWALSCCGWDRSDAEDVLQTSYLKALDGRAVYGGSASFKTWIFGVIRHTAAGHRRRNALRRLLPGALLGHDVPDDGARDSDVELERAEDAAQLVKALGALPRRQRDVLHLVFYQDMRIEDAAAVLGVSLGTARTHYERGKARLRQLLSTEDRR